MRSVFSVLRAVLLALLAFGLTSCGGGGGGGGPTGTAPSIGAQPQSVAVTEGQNARFTVSASGDAPLSYQWKRNGADIAGATAASYAIPVAALADNGAVFSVVVRNGAGSATSANATLTVAAPTGSGTLNGLVYSATTGAAIAGATVTIAGLPATSSAANGTFQLAGVPASERVVLRVSAPGFAETIRVAAVRQGAVTLERVFLQPVGASAAIDPTAAVDVAPAGTTMRVTAPANAFVRADTGAAPSGNLTVELTSIEPARDPNQMPGDFTSTTGSGARPIESFGAIGVVVRDVGGNRYDLATGASATVRIPLSTRAADAPNTIPLYYLDETTGRWIEQGSATLAGTGTQRYYEGTVTHFSWWNADRPLETIWVHGCVQTSQGTRTRNRTVITEGLDYTGTGRAYSNVNGDFSVPMRRDGRAVLRVQGGTETTAPITVGPSATDITLSECLVERGTVTSAPTILVQPANVSTPPNTLARFAVVADGTLPLSYQWQRNGVDIAGASGSGLMVWATAADDGAQFRVVVRNGQGTATSNAATLTVGAATGAPVITQQPASVAVLVGQTATFTVGASGAAPVTYQWRRNGNAIAGATAASYTTPALTLGDNGATYSVVVTNNQGSATSNSALLSVTTSAPADTYKRPLAALFAGTYDVGCSNGAIVIAADGDAAWNGGGLSLASPNSAVSATSGGGLQILAMTDSSIDRSVSIGRFVTVPSASSAQVTMTSSNTVITRCVPGLASVPPAIGLNALVVSWFDGTRGTLQCDVRRGTTTTRESLALAIANGSVTFGAIVFSMSAPRAAESALAIDLVSLGDALISYAATFSDNATWGIARSQTATTLVFNHRTAGGDSYTCTGTRN
ncbi:MAG TPA: immunoglobulin domain-containing protein [Burkholderiaceae bacterium]|nr:immunoglobulin domain-containing protein [Burkholderiaceae bacterium]